MLAARYGWEVPRPLDRASIGALAGGHLAVDFAQGAVPGMLPFFVQERHFSYAAAAGLVLAQTMSSSVVQPVFGRLADRWPLPWLMPVGVALSGLGLGAAGLMPTYTAVWLAIAAGGLGVAALHPEAARYANYASGDRRSTGLAVFQVGGNAGFALGPLLATPVLLALGLEGSWALAIPGLAIAAVLTANLSRIHGHRPSAAEQGRRRAAGQLRDRPGAFARLTVAMVLRSVVFYGLNTFLPLYWIAVLHQTKGSAGAALTVLLVAGGTGTLLGGRLAERHSRRLLITAGCALTGPLILLLTLAPTAALALPLLVPLALSLYVPSSPLVLSGQEYLPSSVGTASGVTLGLAVSVGGVVTPALGAVADRAGLRPTMLLLAAVPVLITAVAVTLPDTRRLRSLSPASGGPS
jgi:FSR family fosmidomycin resistance protein-like MFS transporter